MRKFITRVQHTRLLLLIRKNTLVGTQSERHNSKQIPIDVCLDCGGVCCNLGGVVATKEEVDVIVDRGHPNHFVQLNENVYGTEWGEDGICPYLESGKCIIYPVRPLGCRMYPVVQTSTADVILIECQISRYLSAEELARRKEILLQRPESFIKASYHLREDHVTELRLRASRFSIRKL